MDMFQKRLYQFIIFKQFLNETFLLQKRFTFIPFHTFLSNQFSFIVT